MKDNYVNKIKEWYGKDKENIVISEIYANESEGIYIVKLDNEINLIRVFTLGNNLELSIDCSIMETENIIYNMEIMLKTFYRVAY